MKKVAVIDLGSNSARMSIFDETGRTLFGYRDTVRLSEGMSEDMILKAQPQLRAVKVLKKYKEIIDSQNILHTVAVATAAVRKAKNRQEFLDLAKDYAGISIKVIDGIQEAQLDSLAISRCLDCKKGIICDIGGGSTELIGISDDGNPPMISVPYGSRGICEQFFKTGETPENIQSANRFIDGLISKNKWLDDFKGGTLVGIGGTIRGLAKLDLGDSSHSPVAHYEVSPEHMSKIIDKVKNADIDSRSQMIGIGKERADIILGGLVLLKSVISAANPKKIAVADVGVREGVFYDLTENLGIIK